MPDTSVSDDLKIVRYWRLGFRNIKGLDGAWFKVSRLVLLVYPTQ